MTPVDPTEEGRLYDRLVLLGRDLNGAIERLGGDLRARIDGLGHRVGQQGEQLAGIKAVQEQHVHLLGDYGLRLSHVEASVANISGLVDDVHELHERTDGLEQDRDRRDASRTTHQSRDERDERDAARRRAWRINTFRVVGGLAASGLAFALGLLVH